MLHLTSFSLFLTIVGIFTSISVLGAGQILLWIPSLYYAYSSFKKEGLRLPKSSWFLLSFALVGLLSLVLNHDELIRPSKNYGKLRYLLSGVFFIYALKEFYYKASKRSKAVVLNSGFLSIVLVGIVSIYQVFYLNSDRAKTLTDTLRYGYAMGMIIPLLLAIKLRKNISSHFNEKLLLSAIVFGFIGLYLTYTRGAFLGLICALPFVVFFWNKKKGVISLVISGLFVMFLGVFYLFGEGEIGNRFISSKNNSSDNVRFTQWHAAYKAWEEKPILGIGIYDFINREQAIKEKYNIKHLDYKGHAHNIFLEVLAGTGAVGLLLFLGWIISWIYELFKSNADVKGIFIPFCLAFLISGQFEVVLDANNFSLILLMYALSVSLYSKVHD